MASKNGSSAWKIAVVLNLSRGSRREIFAGFSRRLHELKRPCMMRVIQNPAELDGAAFETLLREGLDGLVVAEALSADVVRRLESFLMPLVVIGMHDDWIGRRERGMAFVRNDDEAVGEAGARHLLENGRFRSFGFVGSETRKYWSALRAKGFIRAVRRSGRVPATFDVVRRSRVAGEARDLGRWLAGLPKPAALMVASDVRALEVLDAAESASIAIPGDLAIATVDNGELVCDFANPPLTGLVPDQHASGVNAAEALAALIDAGGDLPTRTVLNRVLEVVPRETTRGRPSADELSARLLAFVRTHALEDPAPAEVARRCGVSRRLADLRLRETRGTTLAEAILDARLAAVERLLRETSLPIEAVARRCDFPNANSLRNTFRRRTGLSMREWRRNARQPSRPSPGI